MNWKEFKELIESQGMKDDTYISYIDTDMYKPKVVFFKPENSAYIE